MKPMNNKHEAPLPTARHIRRACTRELYRTAKRLPKHIPAEAMQKAEEAYRKKVMLDLLYIVQNGSNKSLLADWFEEHVADEVAALWELEPKQVAAAFRAAFGG
ncbi:dehydrogenase [Gorillibacterium sp. CAU 1737]|uniref:dehydrogenase n=1 Tax=Gorillibacterium sp. CAU 1737 TaxID=3140362 RepID=UPI00326158C9